MRADVNAGVLSDASGIFYGVLIALFLALFVASIHFLTIEPDEAWMLLSTGQLVGGPFDGASIIRSPVVTSGGLHTLIHYALLRVGLPIEAHRLVSAVFCVLTLAMVYTLAKAQWGSARAGLLAAAAFLTTPGFLLQAGLATAEMMSTFLLIAAAWHWTARGSASLTGSVVSGVLFGLSLATRMSALVALPAIVFWSLLYARMAPRIILYAAVAVAIASAIFLLSVSTYYSFFNQNDIHAFAQNLAGATGASQYKDMTLMMSYFATSESVFPAFMMAVAAVALALPSQRDSFAAIRPLCVLLLLISVIDWVAWIAKAPIPHLRYLWPTLPALWLCGVLLLLSWLMALEPGRARLLLHATIVSVWATQFALSFREVAYGDSLTLVYEAARRAPISQFKPFRARRDQDRLASMVAGLPADAQVYVLLEPVAYPITWLTGRRIRSLSRISEPSSSVQGDRYLILFPTDKNVWNPTLVALDWIQANTTLYSRFGDYSVYRIKADAPGVGMHLLVNIGQQPHPL
jgi:4-amino-4-deoxy-L-arabinose transferase-like glycosyltransferase